MSSDDNYRLRLILRRRGLPRVDINRGILDANLLLDGATIYILE